MRHPRSATWLSGALLYALLGALPVTFSGPAAAQAQSRYKVIGPDGSVTYTDRPPTASDARITPLNRLGTTTSADAALPFELRQVATRFPVTLYTTGDCPACDAGRQLLQQRGVPYTERRVVSEEDAATLERAVGGRTVPALTIGQQALRGLSSSDWTAYLDAAGYPSTSRLPRGYAPAAPASAPRTATAAGDVTPAPLVPDPAPQASEPQTPAPPASAPGGIRF